MQPSQSFPPGFDESPSHSSPIRLPAASLSIPISPIEKLNFDNYVEETYCFNESLSSSSSSSSNSAERTKLMTAESMVSIDLKTTLPSKSFGAKTLNSTCSSSSLPPLMPNYSQIAGKLSNVPRFHFPAGKPVTKAENGSCLSKIEAIFNARPNKVLRPRDFGHVCWKMGLPVYIKKAVYEAVCQCSKLNAKESPRVSFFDFVLYWNRMIQQNHDEASRFIFTLAVAKTGLPARSYLEKEDFHSILYDLIATYPGLLFLVDSTFFHARYVDVVCVRIFWNVNRSWSGRITTHELRKSNFLETMHLLEENYDMRKITDYFSYTHFCVIYNKFWDVDADHDMRISREDMKNHCDGALTNMIIDRVFSNAVNRSSSQKSAAASPSSSRRGPVKEAKIETIGFEEFVAFLLAEVDKRHPTSIEYWFRCMDLDGDGIISTYEMEEFYGPMLQKCLANDYGAAPDFDILVNQLYDVVSPKDPKQITLRDLKRCGLSYRFFNTFVNYFKFKVQDTSESFKSTVKANGEKEMSDWDKFCVDEYEGLQNRTEESREKYSQLLDDDDDSE